MEDVVPYHRARLTETLSLCVELEDLSDDKELIYSFLCIPFDEKDEVVHELWLRLFKSEMNGEHYEYDEFLLDPMRRLADLERQYKLGDLLYIYYRHINAKETAAKVLEQKRVLSEKITDILG